MKKYQEQSQSSKQQHFSPGFRFLNFCLGSGNTPWLENPPCHQPLTWLSDKCLLWADPRSTKRRQNRPCAEEAPGLGQEQGRIMDPDHWVRWSIGLGSPEGCGSQRREHSLAGGAQGHRGFEDTRPSAGCAQLQPQCFCPHHLHTCPHPLHHHTNGLQPFIYSRAFHAFTPLIRYVKWGLGTN